MSHFNQQHTDGVPTELWLTPVVYTQIQETIGARKAESGGMLGGDRESGQVTAFYFDEEALAQNSGAYSPNHTLLTRVLRQEWKPKGIQLLGFVHSHPPHYNHPSPWDKEYAEIILERMGLSYLLLPIVRTAPDAGAFSLFAYVARQNGAGTEISKQGLRIGGTGSSLAKQLQGDGGQNPASSEVLAEIVNTAVDLTADSIALVQAVRTLKQQDKGETSRER